MKINLSEIKKIHFIGIKGVAMSGLAVICKERGIEVAGSDVGNEFITDKVLREKEIYVFPEFNPQNLGWHPELVVIGASWDKSNPEVKEAYGKKMNIIQESELRGLLSREKITIAVTGVHGKTTTTSLLSYIFFLAGLKPSYLIGTALIPDLGVNGHWDDGKFFIVEGDEYAKSKTSFDAKFLDLSPDCAIITNIEWEHVDVYESVEALEEAFRKLIKLVKSRVFACVDWPIIQSLTEDFPEKIVTYGNNMSASWRLNDFLQKFNYSEFSVRKENRLFDEFELRLLGRFNALNAIACMAVALNYGISLDVIKEAFKTFSGLERRMETDTVKDTVFIDDYGHHPTEVAETLRAIRGMYVKRNIICIFQSHSVTRTMAFLDQFAKSFNDADTVILTDIFKSARESNLEFTTKDLFEKIRQYHANVLYFGDIEKTAENLLPLVKPRDVVVTMGAGDVYKIKKHLMENL